MGDISENGARLKYSDAVIPTHICELHIPAKGQIIRAVFKWQKEGEIGIAFARDTGCDADLRVRVGRLEAEVTLLKKLIKRQKPTNDLTDAA